MHSQSSGHHLKVRRHPLICELLSLLLLDKPVMHNGYVRPDLTTRIPGTSPVVPEAGPGTPGYSETSGPLSPAASEQSGLASPAAASQIDP
jgi:hypothetical protein